MNNDNNNYENLYSAFPMIYSKCFTEMTNRLSHPQPSTICTYNRYAHFYNKHPLIHKVNYRHTSLEISDMIARLQVESFTTYRLVCQIMTNLSSPPDARNLPFPDQRTQFTHPAHEVHLTVNWDVPSTKCYSSKPDCLLNSIILASKMPTSMNILFYKVVTALRQQAQKKKIKTQIDWKHIYNNL